MDGNGDGDLNLSMVVMLGREFHRPELGKDGTSKLPFLLAEVIAAHAVSYIRLVAIHAVNCDWPTELRMNARG